MSEPAPAPAAEPYRTPDAADLALAKVAQPWAERWHTSGLNERLAEALTAWLAARGIY